MAVRKAGIWCNRNKAEAVQAAEKLICALHRYGIDVGIDEQTRCMLGSSGEENLCGSDMLITLGGDGTLLSGLEEALRLDVPMLGINLGHLGFLTEIEPSEIDQAAARLAAGDYTLEQRMLLELRGCDLPALNEVTVSRAPSSRRILTLAVYVNGRLTQHFAGDGLIVATPTGSTGYSMSAGGPIVSPGVDLMLLTPVCAHTPHAKPVIVPADSQVRVVLQEDCEAVLSMDGRFAGTLKSGARAVISRSKREARFVRMDGEEFFERLKSKLLAWGR